MLLPYSSNVHFTAFSSTFPSKSSIILSLGLAILLLAICRLVFSWVTTVVGFRDNSRQKQSSLQASDSKASSSWSLFTFESLPLSLSMSAAPTSVGQGIGLQKDMRSVSPPQVPQAAQLNWQSQRGGSVDGRPPPSANASQQPLSMAKIIMSRHTFRRPAPPSSRRPAALPPSPVRQQSMV